MGYARKVSCVLLLGKLAKSCHGICKRPFLRIAVGELANSCPRTQVLGGELKSTSSKALKSATLNKVSDLLPWENSPACRAIVTDRCCSLKRVNLGSRGICKKGLLHFAVW